MFALFVQLFVICWSNYKYNQYIFLQKVNEKCKQKQKQKQLYVLLMHQQIGQEKYRESTKYRNNSWHRNYYEQDLEKIKQQRNQMDDKNIFEIFSDQEEFEEEWKAYNIKKEEELLNIDLNDILSTKSQNSEEKKEKKQKKDKKEKKERKDKKDKKERKEKKDKKKEKKEKKQKKIRKEEEVIIQEPLQEEYNDPSFNFSEMIGPQPLYVNAIAPQDRGNYGGQFFQGEGTAMAHYIQQGKRIPRRGEVGLSSEQIENYEKLGYVMSGSRHKRMTAVRLKKEQQVYSVEEKRALAIFNYEQKLNSERKFIEDMHTLIAENLQK